MFGYGEINNLHSKIDSLEDELKEFVQELLKSNSEYEKRVEELVKQNDTQRLQLTQLKNKLHSVTEMDALTSSYNRIKCEETLKELINSHTIFSIMVIDVDNFSSIHDQHDSKISDYVLAQVTRIVKRFAGNGSFLARWTRDSFILIDQNITLDEMVEKADEICDEVEHYRFNNIGTVTVSIGVSRSFANSDMQSIIQQVIKTLRKAKINGKNQVSV